MLHIMTISLFSGQGSQYEGMGKDIAESTPELLSVYETGSEILGKDLKEICFSAPLDELSRTVNSQPAIMATSIICLEAAKKKGFTFDGVAGHSLGEYAALVTAGAVDLTTGFTLIKHRAACMDKAAKKNGGKMAAIIGLPSDVIETVCAEVNGSGDYVVPVNYNTSVQTVIAGSEAGVAKAAELLKAKGAKRAVPLAVAAAFHSEYMKDAGLEFKELIKDIAIAKPQKAFYSNVTGARLDDFSDIHDILSRHIYSPVRFTSELAAMQADGIDSFVECGPGKALTGMVKKTLEGITAEATDL